MIRRAPEVASALAAGLDAYECFFTNAYVGLKAGDDPTGPFPGANDPESRAWRRGFLEDQIELMRPRVIATMGSDARRFVATMAPELSGWTSQTESACCCPALRLR